ncbi:hypothetical protein C8Q73DRAFT_712176 [Cubamyces lactineus]|nr:hypothetical protein C8Q73DRAFT_712176 [Cubamyces lactineus]
MVEKMEGKACTEERRVGHLHSCKTLCYLSFTYACNHLGAHILLCLPESDRFLIITLNARSAGPPLSP